MDETAPEPRGPKTHKLLVPVQMTKDILVEELVLKRSARALKDLELPMRPDGTMMFRPYELARAGLQMAGQPSAMLDKMDPADVNGVALLVLGFLA